MEETLRPRMDHPAPGQHPNDRIDWGSSLEGLALRDSAYRDAGWVDSADYARRITALEQHFTAELHRRRKRGLWVPPPFRSIGVALLPEEGVLTAREFLWRYGQSFDVVAID